MEFEELKMWCAVRTDIEMSRGKLATQAGHAYCGSLDVAMRASPDIVEEYLAGHTPKITVGVGSEADLEKVYHVAVEAGIPAVLVEDLGRTEFDGPTKTCVAFGPTKRSTLPSFLKRLQLLKDK